MDIKTLANITSTLGEKLKSFSDQDFEYNYFEIECKDLPLPRYEGESIYKYNSLKDFFSNLNVHKDYPYVYWFEVTDHITCEEIREIIRKYTDEIRNEIFLKVDKNSRNFYSVPAMTKHIKKRDSKVLYVGKVKKDLAGRLVPHLGYYHRSPNTQGLQLSRWAKDLNLNLKFHFIRLPKELKELTSFYEFQIAKDLKPILGRHSG